MASCVTAILCTLNGSIKVAQVNRVIRMCPAGDFHGAREHLLATRTY